MRIGFHGAARTVTGSKYLLTYGSYRLLVDCGLFQGEFETHQRNWRRMPFEPRSVGDVVFTHAHIDHTGYYPRLFSHGFPGRGYASPPTKGLLGVVLPDSGRLQEEEARYLNKFGLSRHPVAEPLYTESQAVASLRHLSPLPFHESREIHPGLHVTLQRAGHILGAASVAVRYKDAAGERRTIVFSGDLGRRNVPILVDPEPVPEADWIVVESTYGDRLHEKTDPREQIRAAIVEGLERGGTILVPAFAVGRTQELMYHLSELFRTGALPHVPVYIDSPMATSVIELYARHQSEYDEEMLERMNGGSWGAAFPWFHVCRTREESKQLNDSNEPIVVISASGMATGGRVLHHLLHRLPDPSTTVLFVGYQAAGTLGRRLVEGATEVKVLGEPLKVAAAIRQLPSMSAHADADELMAWLATAPRPPKGVFVTHGEPAAQEALAARITGELGWNVRIPEPDEEAEI